MTAQTGSYQPADASEQESDRLMLWERHKRIESWNKTRPCTL